MVPLIGGMNSEPRRLTAKVAARLIWQRPVSSKYPRYLLGAACIKQNSIFQNSSISKVWPKFWEVSASTLLSVSCSSSSEHYCDAQRLLVGRRFRKLFQQPDGQRYLSFKRASRPEKSLDPGLVGRGERTRRRSQARVGDVLGSYRGGKRCPLVSLMTKFC
jgi:hypothetical protein